MYLKPEAAHALERELKICDSAISRLQVQLLPLERQYGWTTDTFLRRFNAGEVGDNREFFLWFALAESIEDWRRTRDGLEELLETPERVSA